MTHAQAMERYRTWESVSPNCETVKVIAAILSGPETKTTHEMVVTEHLTTEVMQENGEIRTSCSCGASWTHPTGRSPYERLAINEAHSGYAQRLKSVVL